MSEEMSQSALRGNSTYRRGPASTARSTTSIDTNVLLRQADVTSGLDTARSAASVDTDVLLGDLASARDVDDSSAERPVTSTYTKSTETTAVRKSLQSSLSVGTEAPLNSTFTQPTSLHASFLDADDPALISVNTTFISSAVEAPLRDTFTQPVSLPTLSSSAAVDQQLLSDDGRRSGPVAGSKDHFHVEFADELSPVPVDRSLTTARSVTSAYCEPVDYDEDELHGQGSPSLEVSFLDKRHLSEDFRPADVPGSDPRVFETSELNERRFSGIDDALCRSDSSLDAAMRLRDSTFSPADTDDVPLDSGTTSRTLASVDTNILLQTTENVVMAMEAARTNHHSNSPPRDPSPPPTFSHKDVHGTRDYINHLDADYETATDDIMGNTRAAHIEPRSSVHKRLPLADNRSRENSASRNVRRDTREAWGNGNPPDHDFSTDLGPSRQRTWAGNRTLQSSQQRATTADSDGGRDLAGRSEYDRRRYNTPLGSRSGTRTYPGQDSDRSLTSSASLGAQIVAKSRQNSRVASGKATRTSGVAARKNTEQRDRDLSPSGLVLEGCRVELRRSAARSHDRPSSASVKPISSAAGRSLLTGTGSRPHRSGTSDLMTSSAAGGRGTVTRQNGWTDDQATLNDSLFESTSLNRQVSLLQTIKSLVSLRIEILTKLTRLTEGGFVDGGQQNRSSGSLKARCYNGIVNSSVSFWRIA